MKYALILALFSSTSALAGSVDWKVGEVTGTVLLKGGKITSAKAVLGCHFEDSAGAIEGYPEKELETSLEALPSEPGDGTNDFRYRVKAVAGRLKARKLFAALRSCAYTFELVGIDVLKGKQIDGGIHVAGGSTYDKGVEEMVKDANLNQKISARMNPTQLYILPWSPTITDHKPGTP